jgi:hypothetical protein
VTPGDAAALAALLCRSAGEPQIAGPCLALLARWARQLAMSRGAGGPQTQHAATLEAAAAAAQRILLAHGLRSPAGGAAVAFLGCAAGATGDSAQRDALAEAVGGALLRHQGALPAAAAVDAVAAAGALLPALTGAPDAACWVLAALLACLANLQLDDAGGAALEALAPLHPAVRGAAMAVLRASPAPERTLHAFLHPLYGVLRPVLLAGDAQPAARRAAGLLAAGGLLEGLLHEAAALEAAGPLIAALERHLLQAAAEVTSGLARDACALALVQCYQAGRRQAGATLGSMRCMAGALLESGLSLRPLDEATQAGCGAGAQAAARAAAEALRRRAAGALGRHAAALAAAAAEQCRRLGGAEAALALQGQVEAAARRANEQYRRFALAGGAAGLEQPALRQLLDRLFAAGVALMAAAWAAAPLPGGLLASIPAADGPPRPAPPPPAGLAAGVVAAAADLQFCRRPLPLHADLLRAALRALPSDPTAAARLAAALPRYGDLEARAPGAGGAPAWLVDGVSAARAQLLLAALASCAAGLPTDVAMDGVAPVAFLYMLHPHPPAAGAAHDALCALLAALPPPLCEQLAPFYLARCLEGCPGVVSPARLAQGLATAAAGARAPSAAVAACVGAVAAAAAAAARRGADGAAAALMGAAAAQLFAVHHSQVGAVAEALEAGVRGCPPAGRAALAAAVYDAVAASADGVRTRALAARYQGARARCGASGGAAGV